MIKNLRKYFVFHFSTRNPTFITTYNKVISYHILSTTQFINTNNVYLKLIFLDLSNGFVFKYLDFTLSYTQTRLTTGYGPFTCCANEDSSSVTITSVNKFIERFRN